MYVLKLLIISAALFIILPGCGSSVYVSNDSTTQMDDKYSDTDLKIMAQKMYQSIQDRLNLIREGKKKRPIIAFLNIANRTSEYIDTDAIADKLQINLLKSGTLRFVDRQKIKAMTSQFDLAASGMMDPETVKKAGKVLGNDYFLSGVLSSIEKQDRIKKEKSKSFIDW